MKGRVVIAGAGIAGLSAAVAVGRAGYDVQILERDPRPRNHGGALMLWSNATRALHELDLLDPVLRRAQRIDRAIIESSRGAQLTELDLARVSRRLGSPCVVISRRALLEVLLSAAPAGALRLGARCVGFSAERGRPGAVTVHLESGEPLDADALVGADGLGSRVRATLSGDAPPREAHQTAWLGMARLATLPRGETRAILGPGRRFWCTRVGRSRTYWYAVVADAILEDPSLVQRPSVKERARGRTAHRARPQRGARDFPRAAFAGWPACVAALLEATEAITRVRIADRPPLPCWGRGPVTLLGDAAHPTTPDLGQGACQALESAAALGRALARESNLEPALRAYERDRHGRAEMFTNISYIAASSTASGNAARQALAELALLSTPSALSEARLVSLLARDSGPG